MTEIKKAIIPVAGAGTRFLPLSKIVPKIAWPVVDKPMIYYSVAEGRAAEIKEFIFVSNTKKNSILDYFFHSPSIDKFLKSRKRENLLKELEEIKELAKDTQFCSILQKQPLGDGHAILQAASKVGNEPCGVMFSDDIIDAKIPCISQLMNIYKTSQRPVLALSRAPKERISSYGVVRVEKIARRVYKIREIVEKPEAEKAPSDLAIVGRYILTPEAFEYLKKAKPNKSGEIILAEVLNKMLLEGKNIYGYEFEGRWLECGTKSEWLKTHAYLSLQDPQFGSEIKNFLKENKII